MDGAIDDVARDVADYLESERDLGESPRVVRGPLTNQLGAAGLKIVPAFLDHMDDVHRHAPGERKRKRLNGRWSGQAGAIEHDRGFA